MNNFPEFCVRGLRGKDDKTEDGDISASAFYPDPTTVHNRTDGMCETSIDWEDHDQILPSVLDRFRYGAAKLPTSHIDQVNTFTAVAGGLGYERQPLTDNPHHGNLLFPVAITSQSKRRSVWATLLAANAILCEK